MKLLIYTAAFTLLSAFWIPSAQGLGVSNPSTSHLIHSAAIPNNSRVPIATYQVTLQVMGAPLTQLTIDLPKGVNVTQGVEMTNQTGQNVEATVSMSGSRMVIAFAQPIAPDTTLQVNLNGVRTSDLLGRTWFLPITGKSVGETSDIPYGVALIQTHK